MGGTEAGFFGQFSLGAEQEGFTDWATSLDDFPGIGIERISILANQIGETLGIDGHDTDRYIFKGNDTINPRVSGGIEYLVFLYLNPGIGINEFGVLCNPGVCFLLILSL
jgi:hypothetical protein